MHSIDVLAAAQRLQQQEQDFCLVSVLRVQAPASARPGDKAVVTAQGIVAGWIGGGCAQPAVLRTVRQALADGKARMIRIAPSDSGGEPRELDDVLEFGMACHSGGTLELFVDPVLPRSRLTVIGDSPVAVALAGLAPRVGLAVTVIAQGADPTRFADAGQVLASDDPAAAAQAIAPGSLVVVATQGRRDVQGLRAALALSAHTVWLVASARKAQVLKEALVAAGHDADAVAAIVAPAGLPMAEQMGAHTPEEVALSVLAAVVAARRRGRPVPAPSEVAAVDVALPASASASASAAEASRSAAESVSGAPAAGGSCCGGGPLAPVAQAKPAPASATAAAPDAALDAARDAAPRSCCGGEG